METYSIFVASSMRNPLREEIRNAVEEINDILKGLRSDFNFEVVIYSESPLDDRKPDTQNVINAEAVKSHLFILLADNNSRVGEFTFDEYSKAHEQSLKSGNKCPYIKAFIIKEKDEEPLELNYVNAAGKESDFEKRLYDDSKRYIQFIRRDKFINFFKRWLVNLSYQRVDNFYDQTELSYSTLLRNNGQLIRRSDNKYYRRKGLDDRIDEILEWSPVIILEGNTYSGKTRAAIEKMKSNEEWKEYDFHVYSGKDTLDSLNKVKLNLASDNTGDVFLFDDISEIILDSRIDYSKPLWAKMSSFNDEEWFKKEDFGNIRLIFTVSGKLNYRLRMQIYKKIFNVSEVSSRFEEYLNEITVNFDIYDKASFREMVDEMRRNGEIIGNFEKGNYTIGSLFVKELNLNSYEGQKILLKTLVGHYKYPINSSFCGNVREIKNLYEYLGGNKFDSDVEELRKNGIVALSPNDTKLNVDKYILKQMHAKVVEDEYRSNNNISSGAKIEQSVLTRYEKEFNIGLYKSLLEYANDKSGTRPATETEDTNCSTVTRMGYLLCDRNKLPDDEILKILNIASDMVLGIDSKGIIKIKNLIEVCNSSEEYSMRFCASAIARLENFKIANSSIGQIRKYYQDKGDETAKKLFKQMVYAMFSKGNRIMTMEEEKIMLAYIFNEDKSWLEPFCRDDLNDVFNLQRISPYLSLAANEILDYIPNVTLDGCEMSQLDNDEEYELKYDFDFLSVNNTSVNSKYERVFVPRVGEVVITALMLINSFDEFLGVKNKIEVEMEKTPHLKSAIIGFTYKFYKSVPDIARRLKYEDRKLLFDFIFNISSDKKSIFGDEELSFDYRNYRIIALNQLLELLDENDAIDSFEKMLASPLHDKRTLSHLFNNEFLNFEQMIHLVEKQKNFITLNQLLNIASTKSDAQTCLKLMNIEDGDAAKLKDERALSQYLDVDGVNLDECIAIIRRWHDSHQNSLLSASCLLSFIKKLPVDDIAKILVPGAIEQDYMQLYGLHNDEVLSMRNNAAYYNLLIYRANLDENCANLVDAVFDMLIKDNKLLPLVVDSECNRNNSILSVYIKNRWLFPDYESAKEKVQELYKQFESVWRIDENVFSPLVWWCKKSKDIGLLNNILREAYTYFAAHYTRKDVERMMATLYHYIPSCIDEKCFFGLEEVNIAFENSICKCNGFSGYLEYVYTHNPNYVDATFIFNTLSRMEKNVDEEVYKQLEEFARLNRKGVKFDTIEKLPKPVRNRLFWVDRKNGNITINTDLVTNIPVIKMLWYILNQGLLNVEQVEDYRKKNGVAMTQTYLNMLFKALELCEDDNKFNKMIALLPQSGEQESFCKRTVQMCISCIKSAPDEKLLDAIFTDYGFGAFRNRTEVIGARISRLLSLRYNERSNIIEVLNKEIIDKREYVNITVVNSYLYALLMISMGDMGDDRLDEYGATKLLESCWKDIVADRHVDMNRLLQLSDDSETWKIEADAQTVSYFAGQCEKGSVVRQIHDWFDGDFYYDEEKKKSCLIDAMKNYCRIVYIDRKTDLDEVDFIVNNVLLADRNRGALNILCKKYVYRTCENGERKLYSKLFPFWYDAVNTQIFIDYLKSKKVKL